MAISAPFLVSKDIAAWGPTGSLKKYRVENLEVRPIEAEVYDSNIAVPLTMRDQPIVGPTWTSAHLEVLMSGSGETAPITAPPDGPLIKACALKETSAGTPVSTITYAVTGEIQPSTSGGDQTACDMAFYRGNGLACYLTSAAGNVEWVYNAGKPARVIYDLVGIGAAMTEASSSESAGDAAVPPVCKALTATVGGKSVTLKELRITAGNVTNSPFLSIEASTVNAPIVIDQVPLITARFIVPAASTLNPFTLFTGGTVVDFAITLGTAAGNTCATTVKGFIRSLNLETIDGLLGVNIACDMDWDNKLQHVWQ